MIFTNVRNSTGTRKILNQTKYQLNFLKILTGIPYARRAFNIFSH